MLKSKHQARPVAARGVARAAESCAEKYEAGCYLSNPARWDWSVLPDAMVTIQQAYVEGS